MSPGHWLARASSADLWFHCWEDYAGGSLGPEHQCKGYCWLRLTYKVWTKEYVSAAMWLQDQSEVVQDRSRTSAQLNWISRDCTLPSTQPRLWLSSAYAQHTGLIGKSVIFTKNPTGFQPQDCEPSLWGEKRNRWRIDEHEPHAMILPSLVMWSHFFHLAHVYLDPRFTPGQHLVTSERVVPDAFLICLLLRSFH